MGKLKLIYDVVKAMKEKEVFKGILKAEVNMDQAKVLSFSNEFEKNTTSGEVKAKISTEVDCDGKKIKHESNTEFNVLGCCGGRGHGGMMHQGHHHLHGHFHGRCGGGLKGKLNKLAFILGILHKIEVKEQEDASVLLSLELNELPEEMKKIIEAKCQNAPVEDKAGSANGHHHLGCIKELANMDDVKVNFNAKINPNKEVEKIELVVSGKCKGDGVEIKAVSGKAELNLSW